MLRVQNVAVRQPYLLDVTLSNGLEGVFDVSPYLSKGIFAQLADRAYFQQVRINFCGICWPRGQDFSAETIASALLETQPHETGQEETLKREARPESARTRPENTNTRCKEQQTQAHSPPRKREEEEKTRRKQAPHGNGISQEGTQNEEPIEQCA